MKVEEIKLTIAEAKRFIKRAEVLIECRKEKMKAAWILRKEKGVNRNSLGHFVKSEPQEEFDQRYAA